MTLLQKLYKFIQNRQNVKINQNVSSRLYLTHVKTIGGFYAPFYKNEIFSNNTDNFKVIIK